MEAKPYPKKRKPEKSPPTSSQKRIKKMEKIENPRLELSIPLIENLTIGSSGNSPKEPSAQERQRSEDPNPRNPTVENHSKESSGNPPSSQKRQQSENPTITNLETGKPIQILPDFCDKMNKDFIIRPKDQNLYEHLFQMSAKPYEFSFECSQWINTQLVRYNELDEESYCLIGDQIYLQKLQEKQDSLDTYLEQITYKNSTEVYYFRGLLGIGKSYRLIQSVLKYRRKQNYRILHIILDRRYKLTPRWNFLFDFFYCFHNDFKDPDFPEPPKIDNFQYNEKMDKGENWFEFLSTTHLENVTFLEEISEYLKSKQIAFLLIWDQDNIFQNKKKKDSSSYTFLTSLRKSKFFNLILIAASNNDEDFEILNDQNSFHIIVGFSLEETKEFINNFLEKLIGYPIKINNDFLEDLYKLTNGNGYLLSKFVQSKGQTLEEKFANFTQEITGIFRWQLSIFFEEKMKNWQSWKVKFPLIITYLDTDYDIPMDHYAIADKNFSYIENSKLKSANLLAKKIYLEAYKEEIRIHHLI